MARTTSVTVGEHLNEFINSLIKSGRYGSTSEVMRSALRLLEEREHNLSILRDAVGKGDSSGESELTLKDIATMIKRRNV